MRSDRQLADETDTQGLAAICGHDGIVRTVLRNDLELFGGDVVGQSFAQLLAPSSFEKARLFVAEAVTAGAAFDWELGVMVDGEIRLLHFAAAAAEEDVVVIFGAETRAAVLRCYDELMRINNEQANALRAALKLHATQAPPERSAGVYDEMMRLNNELATVQRELTKKNIQLERANQLKNQFLGMAAHDLRNPIGAIRSYSLLLLDQDMALATGQREHFLNRIKSSSEFMLALINDLLDIASIESGQLRIDLRDVDFVRLLTESVQLNRMLVQEKQIDIRLEIAPDVPHIRADALKLEQIVNNLLSNAVKFSARGTAVHVSLRAADGGVWLVVADEGPGIPASEIEGIFRPFQRASPKSTAGERSTGLGLAIVKRAVDGHAGRLICDSEVGRGTTFSAWFPEHGPPG